MDRTKIKGSSNIAEAGYDVDTQTLEIKFHNGGIYRYWPIMKHQFRLFMKAESKGIYFNQNFRKNDSVNFSKVDELQSDTE